MSAAPEGSTYTPLTLITPKLMDSCLHHQLWHYTAKHALHWQITPVTIPLSKKLNRVLATPISGFLNKLEYFKRPKKKKKKVWIVDLQVSMFIYCMYSILGRGSFCFTASIRRGMEVISLWHCWGGMEAQVSLTVAFSSSAFFGLSFLIFLLTIPHRLSGVQVWWVCWPVKYTNTMVI